MMMTCACVIVVVVSRNLVSNISFLAPFTCIRRAFDLCIIDNVRCQCHNDDDDVTIIE